MINKEKLAEYILDKNFDHITVDFCQGDKFLVQDIDFSENDKSLILKLSKHSAKWVELNGKYPVRLSVDNCVPEFVK